MKETTLSNIVYIITRHLDSISAHYNVRDIELCLLSCPSDITALSIIQTYVYLGLEANAFRANYKSVVSEKKSFIAQIKNNNEGSFVYVERATETLVVYYRDRTKNEIAASEFQKIWTGIVILGNKTIQNEKYISLNKRHTYIPYIYLLCIILLMSCLCTSMVWVYSTILDVLGAFLCIGIMKTQSTILYTRFNKFCVANTRFDCEKLDLGKHVAMLSKKNLSRIGLFYFSTRIGALILSLGDGSNITYFTDVLALGAFVVALFSILYQVLARQFCLLCLSVMGVLLAEGLVAYYTFAPSYSLSYTLVMYIALSVLLGGECSWIIECIIKLKSDLLSNRINELKIKRSQAVIEYFFTSPSQIKEDIHSFCVGAQNAPITITTYISPWCSNCEKVVLQMIRLINNYPNYLNWRIYFDSIDINQFEKVNNVQLCLGRGLSSDMKEQDKLEMLNMWYRNKSEKELIERCETMKSNVENIKEMLLKQIEVVKEEKQVPKVWINGRALPDNYSLNDLPFIILELCMFYSTKQ